ncbi:gamma carbonic anhydrase family protein [Blastochloris sulfoviridis]|uniref:Gamma carbonic anhydrase family protein n=1 Tax=Blastochloris sulfoviridis TaxID=50712 RepID=A0A5M6I7G7_9HYPH|nr:gamma carbonic anhydrase family protein [Blastochloris sulfoviridis]KAA5603669.1 gamma carbonic anhydrase family protein [Blastochloris sulfoviridis]
MPIYALDGISPEVPPPGRCWVAPDAVLIGRVRLEDEASVWWRSVLRGDNELIQVGARSNVQDGAMLHTDMGFPLAIGADCTIGHHAILHGCTVGEGSLIGMGATLLNGVVIGRGCLVGANALITEGKTFPDFSLIVGAPARAVRALDPEAVARLAKSATGYVANWKRYAAGLTCLDPPPGR